MRMSHVALAFAVFLTGCKPAPFAADSGTSEETGTGHGGASSAVLSFRHDSNGSPCAFGLGAGSSVHAVISAAAMQAGKVVFRVYHRQGGSQLRPMVAEVKRRLSGTTDASGRRMRLAALVNAGFFDRTNKVSLSYFKSSFHGEQHGSNNQPAGSHRPCAVFHPPAPGTHGAERSDPSTYPNLRALAGAEIFCAGPQLVKGGRPWFDVSARDGMFSPEARPRRDDPLSVGQQVPRLASCLSPRGFQIFAFDSAPVLGSGVGNLWCGKTLREMERILLDAACTEGLNHDGGASVALYLDDGKRTLYQTGVVDDHVPVWLAVLEAI